MAATPAVKTDILALCAPDLQKCLLDWQDYLCIEKQLSPHTLRAYAADITHFINFLVNHFGDAPSLDKLSEIGIRDFRAWMAQKAMDGTSSASRARSLSGAKNFISWLDRQGIMHNAAIKTIRSPKLPHKLPRPLHENQAFEVIESAGIFSKED